MTTPPAPAPAPLDFARLYHGQFSIAGITLFAELGLVQRWLAGEAIDVPAYCEEAGLDPAVLVPYAKYFMWYGYLDEPSPGRYAITEAGRPVFHDWPNAMMHYSYITLLAEIFPLARREKAYGFGKDVYRRTYFDGKGAGAAGARSTFPAIVDYMRKRSMRCIMDIGSGDATFLALACKSFPELRAIGIDQSPVAAEEGQKTFAREGLEGRGVFLVGDMMRPHELAADPRVKDVELASLSFVLHELTYDGPEPVLQFLELWARSFSKVPLAITEFYRLPDEVMRKMSSIPEHLLRHDLSKQKPLQREEWLALFERAGYRVVESIHRTPPQGPVIGKEVLIIEAR